ncbi:MAG: 2,5-diamino-6-(ribosylamino)-4(3H)-pyrimidinone 5'-phosphate reductase [Candidatus Hydrothermarchaeaceae archaeon]
MTRPKVILNAAMTLDGKIATKTGNSEISCKEDLLRVHRLRSEVDAVMVGANTAIIDDPRLTVHKAPHRSRQPTRIVVDSRARIKPSARVFDGEASTIIAVSEKADEKRLREITGKADVIVCGEDKVDLRCLMEALWEKGIKTLMLEGGGNLNWSMFREGLVDEVRVAVAPILVGGKGAITLVEGEGFELIKEGVKLRLKNHYILGEDLVLEYDVFK